MKSLITVGIILLTASAQAFISEREVYYSRAMFDVDRKAVRVTTVFSGYLTELNNKTLTQFYNSFDVPEEILVSKGGNGGSSVTGGGGATSCRKVLVGSTESAVYQIELTALDVDFGGCHKLSSDDTKVVQAVEITVVYDDLIFEGSRFFPTLKISEEDYRLLNFERFHLLPFVTLKCLDPKEQCILSIASFNYSDADPDAAGDFIFGRINKLPKKH